MLLFELFPAFLAIVSVVVAVLLFRTNLRAGSEPEERPRVKPRQLTPEEARAEQAAPGGRRPSMKG